MTISDRQTTRSTFEHCLSIIRQASPEILLLLGGHTAEGKDPRDFLEQLDQARLNLGGWSAVAKRLHMNNAQLSQFTLRLRHLQQGVPQFDSGQEVTENQLLAALRFVASLQQLRQLQPLLNWQSDAQEATPARQTQARRQLRAIELTLKALVTQVWPDARQLNGYLKLHFGADRLRSWLRLGDRQDALNGMCFSELALMVIDKKSFARHYSGLYNDASVLTLFVEPRTTLRMFLDDCRLARNDVLAGKPLTAAQITLLDRQFYQITRPVQRAFEQERTPVDPLSFMTVDDAELERFWERARARDRLGGGDDQEIGEAIDPPRKRPLRTPEEREQLISGALWGAVGAMALVILAGGFWLIHSSEPASASGAGSAPAQAKRESPSARETISYMGISWDTFNMRSAIDRNDTRVTALFLQGGMRWQLAWTEQAFAAGNREVLQLLLRYAGQMDEPRPCRRFIDTLGHEMANGATLGAEYRAYLHRFCAAPAVVARQRHDAGQARLRAEADPSADNTKWLKIQTAIYEAIR